MLVRLLVLPAMLWLLVPPGVCICHLPEEILARMQGQPAPPDDHDHHSGCICHQKPDCSAQDSHPPLHVDHGSFFLLLPPAAPVEGPIAAPAAPAEIPHESPPIAALYLRACALRL